MNYNNQPIRVPINFFTKHDDVKKSLEYAGSHSGGTDFAQTEAVPVAPSPYYNASIPDREQGWSEFRRNPNGVLDYDYAVSKVVDVLHIAKMGIVPLTQQQETILGCLFPNTFTTVPSAMIAPILRTTMRISVLECNEIAVRVAEHLYQEQLYAQSVRGR